MIKQKYTNKIPEKATKLVLLVIAVTLSLSVAILPKVYADQFDEQIKALRQQNAQTRSTVSSLQTQASSYEDAISKLQAQINALQQAIDANRAKQADLQRQIVEAQAELDKEKRVLGESIKAMYVEGQISTLEMLASSKDLSEFVDKQQYRNNVQDKIKSTLDKVTALKLQLQGEKEKVEGLLLEASNQQNQINGARAEQSNLLGLNIQEQNGYNQQIKDNQSKISQLQQQQLAANRSFFGGSVPAGIPGGGGYKYGDAVCLYPGWSDPPCRNYDWGYPGASYPRNLFDEWSYGYRNCTSWVAFKLDQDGRTGFSHLGNAADWPWNVPSSWRTSNPQRGDAAVRPARFTGDQGHVMYVEDVVNGTVYASDYNYGGDGYYRGPRAISTNGVEFIHFP